MNAQSTTQAVLPEDMEEATIDTMARGERGYVVPWAMWVDTERRCWLHPGYTVSARPGGTVQMRVARRPDGGYHVRLPHGERWKPTERPGYVGGEAVEYIPVAEVHRR